MKAYASATNLAQALGILRKKLDKDGMQEYMPLLIEVRVREGDRVFHGK